jgi:predicted SnoaL-like aldol condensation-catalyzing enzyme
MKGGSKMKKKTILLGAISVTIASMWTSTIALASDPVVVAENQKILLKSTDRILARNKRLVYDFYRTVFGGGHVEQAAKYLREDYIQHNPNVATGLKGFLEAFGEAEPGEIPEEIPGLVSIQAERDIVTLSLVVERQDPSDPTVKYTTTWFDMFRIQGGKIAEHWDNALKRLPAPR